MAASAGANAAPDDYRLMEAIAARDPNALRALYDRHSPLVFALCLRVLRDRAAAEELLGDVFLEVWQRSARYDATRGNPVAYLVMLARSRAIDRKRARPKDQPAALDAEAFGLAGGDAPPSDSVVTAERKAIIARALDELDPVQRQAIECAFYDGLSHSEIADKLDRPLGTVKTWIRQGLIRLRDVLRTVNGGTVHP